MAAALPQLAGRLRDGWPAASHSIACAGAAAGHPANIPRTLESLLLSPLLSLPPCSPCADHKPVYAVLEANLPVTNQAKKRGVCSQLLKECAAVALEGATDAAASLAPDHVKLHPSAMPRQMLLLRNDGSQPLLFAVSHGSGDTAAAAVAAAVARHGSEEEAAAVAAAHQLLEVRPVRGVVQPGKDQAIQVHLAGDEWALQGAEQAPEMSYRVCVGSEYSAGGEGNAPGSATLTFTATCLTHL